VHPTTFVVLVTATRIVLVLFKIEVENLTLVRIVVDGTVFVTLAVSVVLTICVVLQVDVE